MTSPFLNMAALLNDRIINPQSITASIRSHDNGLSSSFLVQDRFLTVFRVLGITAYRTLKHPRTSAWASDAKGCLTWIQSFKGCGAGGRQQYDWKGSGLDECEALSDADKKNCVYQKVGGWSGYFKCFTCVG